MTMLWLQLLLTALAISNHAIVSFCPTVRLSFQSGQKQLGTPSWEGGSTWDVKRGGKGDVSVESANSSNITFSQDLPFNWTRVGEVMSANAIKSAKVAVATILAARFLLGPEQLERSLRRMTATPINLHQTFAIDIPILFLLSLLIFPRLVQRFVGDTHTKGNLKFVAEMMGTKFRPRQALLASMMIALVSGVLEEFVCRGILQDALIELLGRKTLAVFFQAVVFGSLHYNNNKSISQVVQTALPGAVSGTLYLDRGHIGAVMMVHAAWNLFLLFAQHCVVVSSQERAS